MKITIKGNDIQIKVSDEAIYEMDWGDLRALEKAIKIIRDIQETIKIQDIELTI